MLPEGRLKRLDDKIQRARLSIGKVVVGSVTPTPTIVTGTPIYDRDGTWNGKIKFVMLEKRKPLTTSEIVSGILEHEPELDRKKVTTSVSATLSVAAEKGVYRKREREGQDMLYML